MSVQDETWDRPICSFCKKIIKYGERLKHGAGKCDNMRKELRIETQTNGVNLDYELREFILNELGTGPKSAKELKKALKKRLKEAWYVLIDASIIEITRDNKLKIV